MVFFLSTIFLFFAILNSILIDLFQSIFGLQVCASRLDPDYFISSVFERCDNVSVLDCVFTLSDGS